MSDPILVAITFLVIGVLALYFLPQRDCPKCPHCRQIKYEAKAAKRAKEEEAIRVRKREAHLMFHKRYGADGCPYCEEHQLDNQ